MYDYKEYAIGVDIGGSHITAAAVSMSDGKLIDDTTDTQPIDNKAGENEITDVWGSVLHHVIGLAGANGLKGIGLAMPGPFDYLNGIALFTPETQKYENIHGLDVRKALLNYLALPGQIPVRFINDATAFAIGEEWRGKSHGSNRSLAITLGTGIGSGFIENGWPVFSSPDIPPDGFIYNLRYQNGIADDYFSTRGLIKAYESLKGESIEGVKEIAALAETDVDVLLMMQNFGTELANLLTPVLHKFRPDVIVLGGNISKAFHLFGSHMKQKLQDEGLGTRIEKSEQGDVAQIVGAARIIDEDYYDSLYKS